VAKRFGFLPYVFFTLSGGCALVYEVTWAKYLALFLGNTTLAHMCVLTAFMGGLALGSVLIGAATGRLRRPLALYGWLEIAIGLYAITFPMYIRPVQSLALAAASGIEVGGPAWIGLKLIVAISMLLFPTFLMGGTFPVLMRHLQPSSSQSDDKAEWLYLANCAGAVGGALLAGFLLIPGFGLEATLTGIGAANAALGAIVVSLALIESPAIGVEKRKIAASVRGAASRATWAVYAAIAVSGFAAMVYELVWICMFAVTLGSSTYSFTLMLAAFISGLALGSMAVGLFSGARRKPLIGFAAAEIAIGLIVLLSLPLYERLPYVFWKWSSLLRPSAQSLGLYNLMKYSLCFVVMLGPTFFFGMTLPLAIKSVIRRDERIGKDTGFVYGANTAGTVVGVLLAGLVLIPLLGLRHSLEFALVANVIAGLLLFGVSDLPRRRLASGAIGVVVIGVLLAMPDWGPMSFVQGTFRHQGLAPASWAIFRENRSSMKLYYYKEDDDGIVAVAETSRVPGRSLYINGKADASSYGDMPTQVLVAQLPMFFKPDAREALVVGLGSGVTAASVLTHPKTRVDCVEISRSVAEAARCFDDVNGRVLENRRFKLILEDARTYLLVTPKKYDAVISEPSNPWVAGMGNLFSVEYYESVSRVLKPGGIVVHWVQAYEISDDLVKMIIRTMRSVFPYVYIFEGRQMDYILMGAREPLDPDFGAMEHRIRLSSVREDLGRISIDSVAALLSRQVLSAERAASLAGDGIINSDDLPVLEYSAPEAQYLRAEAPVIARADERFRGGDNLFGVRYLKSRPLDRATCLSLIRMFADERMANQGLQLALLGYYVSRWQDNASVLSEYGKLRAATDISSAVEASQAASRLTSDRQTLWLQADLLLTQQLYLHSAFTPQDFSAVLKLLDKALEKDPANELLQRRRDETARLAEGEY